MGAGSDFGLSGLHLRGFQVFDFEEAYSFQSAFGNGGMSLVAIQFSHERINRVPRLFANTGKDEDDTRSYPLIVQAMRLEDGVDDVWGGESFEQVVEASTICLDFFF